MAQNKLRLFAAFLCQWELCYSSKFWGIEPDLSKGTARGYFFAHFNHYLQVPVLRSVIVCDDIACSRECLRDTSCFSFNLAVNSDQGKNLRLCELLATTYYYAHESYMPQPSFHHFSVQVSPSQFQK